jgi:hypothetical protein
METSDESQSHDLWAADDMIECAIAARGETTSTARTSRISAIISPAYRILSFAWIGRTSKYNPTNSD